MRYLSSKAIWARILMFSSLLCLPAYSQFDSNFKLIEKNLHFAGKGDATASFHLEKVEPLQFELDYKAEGKGQINGKLVLLVNKTKVTQVKLDRPNTNERLKFAVYREYFQKGENEIRFEVDPPDQIVSYGRAKLYNYYGISPNVPVAYVLYDERPREVFTSDSVWGSFPFIIPLYFGFVFLSVVLDLFSRLII